MLRKLPSSRFEVAAVVFLNANQANKKNAFLSSFQIYNGVSSSDAETNNFLEIGCRDNAILRFDEIIENDYSNFRGISDFIPIIHQEIIVICQIDLDGIGIDHFIILVCLNPT